MKTSEITQENCKKSPLKYLTETPIFAYFLEFVYVLSKSVYLENSATFTRKEICVEVSLYIRLQASSLQKQPRRGSVGRGVLRNFVKFTGKHLCQSLFFNKVAGLRAATLLKKRLWHRYFPVNLAKFLRTPFLQNTSGRLLLSLTLH